MRQGYPGLDLVRLGAALLVALYHLGYLMSPNPNPLFSAGWVGVEIFFVISGFVIAFSADGKTVRQFAVSRFRRLYPAAFVCATILILMPWPYAPAPDLWLRYLKSVTIFPLGPWINPVWWTLPVELMFYSLVGVSLWRGWPLVRVALCLGAYSCGYWLLKLSGVLPAWDTGKFTLTLAYYGVFFALGVLLYARAHLRSFVLFACVGLIAIRDHDGSLAAPLIWLGALGILVVFVFYNPAHWRTRTLGLMTYPLYLLHSIGTLFLGFGLLPALGVSLVAAFAVLPLEKLINGGYASRRAIQTTPGEQGRIQYPSS